MKPQMYEQTAHSVSSVGPQRRLLAGVARVGIAGEWWMRMNCTRGCIARTG